MFQKEKRESQRTAEGLQGLDSNYQLDYQSLIIHCMFGV